MATDLEVKAARMFSEDSLPSVLLNKMRTAAGVGPLDDAEAARLDFDARYDRSFKAMKLLCSGAAAPVRRPVETLCISASAGAAPALLTRRADAVDYVLTPSSSFTRHEEFSMTTLLEQTNELVERTRQAADEARRSDVQSYRKLLARADAPQAGDVPALRALMDRLGLSADDVEADLAILKAAKELETKATRFGDLRFTDPVAEELGKKIAAARQAEIEAKAAVRAAAAELSQHHQRRHWARDARNRLADLKTGHPRLFDVEVTVEKPPAFVEGLPGIKHPVSEKSLVG